MFWKKVLKFYLFPKFLDSKAGYEYTDEVNDKKNSKEKCWSYVFLQIFFQILSRGQNRKIYLLHSV